VRKRRNLDKRNALETMGRQMARERQDTFRGVLSRTRRLEARVDTAQLNVVGGRQLRVTEAVRVFYSLPVEALGKLLFVPGYSKVGGGDVIPPF